MNTIKTKGFQYNFVRLVCYILNKSVRGKVDIVYHWVYDFKRDRWGIQSSTPFSFFAFPNSSDLTIFYTRKLRRVW